MIGVTIDNVDSVALISASRKYINLVSRGQIDPEEVSEADYIRRLYFEKCRDTRFSSLCEKSIKNKRPECYNTQKRLLPI